jgi:hypothetical protein
LINRILGFNDDTEDFQELNPGQKISTIRETGFKIEKLYLDCIDDQGNCFIVYWAKAEFHLLKIIYSGLVFCDAEGMTIEKSSLKKTSKPVINGEFHFKHKFLQTGISLRRIDDPITRSLYKVGMKNELTWNCHHPKALVEIAYNGIIYKGLGYAETLFCPINPLKLPMEELRWGRFLSGSHTVIWINWKYKDPLNKIFLNGSEYNDALFEDETVIFNDGMYRLKFEEIQIIRNGKLSGLFSKMKFLKILIGTRLLDTKETKYKAKTILTRDSVFLSNGWSLFEIVKWRK